MHSALRSSASRDVCRACARRLRVAPSSQSRQLSQSLRPAPRTTTISRPAQPRRHWLSNGAAASIPESPSTRPAASEARPSALPDAPAPTHYDLFPLTLPDGPPPRGHFPIDPRALRREFLQLQARAHPDLHPAASKARAEAASAHINDAYRTLADPLLRAQYLLALQGVDLAGDETAKVEDPELLMTVLEAREEIEAAAEEAELAGLAEANAGRIRESEEVLEGAFREHDLRAAKSEAVRLRYWVNIKESLDNWERGKPIVLEH